MPQLLEFFDKLLATLPDHCADHSKALSEMAMALHYIRRDYPPEMLDQAAIARLEDEIDARIHQDGWLRMMTNEFVLHQCATPYIFVKDSPRAALLHSPAHEALIADIIAHDRMLWETTPYRRLEREWLLAKLGEGPLPEWRDAPVFKDARRAYGFDRMLAYAFTHVVFFAGDFGARAMEDPLIKGAAMLLTVQAEERNDVDLFWECAICMITQPLSQAELDGLLHLLAVTRDRNCFLFDPRLEGAGLREAYHPLLVHDILRGMMLARFGVDIMEVKAGNGPGPLGPLLTLANALGRKDAGQILRALATCEQEEWLCDMVRMRLQALQDLARVGALFARECLALGQSVPDRALHAEYAVQIGAMLEGVGRKA